MAKNLQNSHFLPIFVIKDPLKKLEAKNQNSTSTTFGEILLYTLSQISQRLDENWGSLGIWFA